MPLVPHPAGKESRLLRSSFNETLKNQHGRIFKDNGSSILQLNVEGLTHTKLHVIEDHAKKHDVQGVKKVPNRFFNLM